MDGRHLRAGCRLTSSARPFPGCALELNDVREALGGYGYRTENPPMEGALFRFFEEAIMCDPDVI